MPPKKDKTTMKLRSDAGVTESEEPSSTGIRDLSQWKQGSLTAYLAKTPKSGQKMLSNSEKPQENTAIGIQGTATETIGNVDALIMTESNIAVNTSIADSVILEECASPNNTPDLFVEASLVGQLYSTVIKQVKPAVQGEAEGNKDVILTRSADTERQCEPSERMVIDDMSQEGKSLLQAVNEVTVGVQDIREMIGQFTTSVLQSIQHLTEIVLDGQTIETKRGGLLEKHISENNIGQIKLQDSFNELNQMGKQTTEACNQTLKVVQRLNSRLIDKPKERVDRDTPEGPIVGEPEATIEKLGCHEQQSGMTVGSTEMTVTSDEPIPSTSISFPIFTKQTTKKKTDKVKGCEQTAKKRKVDCMDDIAGVNDQNVRRGTKCTKKIKHCIAKNTTTKLVRKETVKATRKDKISTMNWMDCVTEVQKTNTKERMSMKGNNLYFVPFANRENNVPNPISFNRATFLTICSRYLLLNKITTEVVERVAFIESEREIGDITVITFTEMKWAEMVWRSREEFCKLGVKMFLKYEDSIPDPIYENPLTIRDRALARRPLPPIPSAHIISSDDGEVDETVYETDFEESYMADKSVEEDDTNLWDETD